MAQIKAYSSENFERNKLRYIIFSSVFILIFAVSIFYKNIVWAILMFFLLGGYLYYGIINNQELNIKITDNWLMIGSKISNWTKFSWYCLEIDPVKQKIKNIVFIAPRYHNIHTINDTDDNIKEFLQELNNYLPMTWEFPQTFREKASRKMKL
jgi:hypothetical protein